MSGRFARGASGVQVGLEEGLELRESALGSVSLGGKGDDVAVTGAQRHNAQDGGGVDGGAALLGDGDRDALLGDGLDEGGGRTGVQPDLGSDGGERIPFAASKPYQVASLGPT